MTEGCASLVQYREVIGILVVKQLGRIDEFKRRGKTIVAASHDLALIEWMDLEEAYGA